MINRRRDRVLSSLRRVIQAGTLGDWIRAVKLNVARNYKCRLYIDEGMINALHDLVEKTKNKVPKPFNVFYFVLYDKRLNRYYLVAAIYKVLFTATMWTTIVEETDTAEQMAAILNNAEEQDNIVEDIVNEINKFNVALSD
jgi:p-aminobenzoyl-glutamate transporter AbgT